MPSASRIDHQAQTSGPWKSQSFGVCATALLVWPGGAREILLPVGKVVPWWWLVQLLTQIWKSMSSWPSRPLSVQPLVLER